MFKSTAPLRVAETLVGLLERACALSALAPMRVEDHADHARIFSSQNAGAFAHRRIGRVVDKVCHPHPTHPLPEKTPTETYTDQFVSRQRDNLDYRSPARGSWIVACC